MTNNELIKELVKYDGYTYIETVTDGYFTKEQDNQDYHESYTYIDLEDYLTDMNILHRIAVKVVMELFSLNSDTDDFYRDMEIGDVREQITRTFLIEANEQGEHLQLATALVNAIRYISANKAG